MKVYSSKITELWDTRGIFFDKLWHNLKGFAVAVIWLGVAGSLYLTYENIPMLALNVGALLIISDYMMRLD